MSGDGPDGYGGSDFGLGLCFEPAVSARNPKPKFMPESRPGGYSKLPTYPYAFVGEGLGDHELEVKTIYTGWRMRPCCVGCLAFLMVAGSILLGALCLLTASNRGRSFSWQTPAQMFHLGYFGLKFSTTLRVVPVSISTTIGTSFNCRTPEWSSAAEQKWCCEHKRMGCTTTVAALFDCGSGPMSAWSAPQIHWCCEQHNIGCPLTTTHPPYDCAIGFSSCYSCLARRWSIGKIAWCCHNEKKGCPPTTTPYHFDCNAGYSNFVKGWSAAKKVWCCKWRNRGCPGMEHDLPPPPAVAWTEFNGHQYLLMDGLGTWDQQKSKCESLDAHMVTIGSAEENRFVTSMMPAHDVFRWQWLWIGMKPGSAHTWIDGSEVRYKNWNPGQPEGGRQHCAEIYRPTGDNWHDNMCNQLSRTVCEKNSPPRIQLHAQSATRPATQTSSGPDTTWPASSTKEQATPQATTSRLAHLQATETTLAPQTRQTSQLDVHLTRQASAPQQPTIHTHPSPASQSPPSLSAQQTQLSSPLKPTQPPTQPHTVSVPYDCGAGYSKCYDCLVKQWSVSKLAWCCNTRGVGCVTTVPDDMPMG